MVQVIDHPKQPYERFQPGLVEDLNLGDELDFLLALIQVVELFLVVVLRLAAE